MRLERSLETVMLLRLPTMPPLWRLCLTALMLWLSIRIHEWTRDDAEAWNPDRLRHRVLESSKPNVLFDVPSALDEGRTDHRDLHMDEPMNVTINLELYYLNETVADMLSPQDEPLNSAAAHFCWAVSEQAGGAQVRSALSGTGIVIDTHVVNNSSGCSILEANRVIDNRGEALYGDGVNLVLLLQVQQLVYLTSGSILSQAEVEEIVDLGFKRAVGGRAAFRSLLRQSPTFSTIDNVEVFTLAPSLSPSNQPSGLPSDQPSMPPTMLPSSPPTFPLPSFSPTIPSDATSLVPTANFTDTRVNSSSGPNSGLIYGSVLGSLGVLLLLCFCILCTWYPICSRSRSAVSSNSSCTESHAGMEESQDNDNESSSGEFKGHAFKTEPMDRILVVDASGKAVEIGRANSFDNISAFTDGTNFDWVNSNAATATEPISAATALSPAPSNAAQFHAAGEDISVKGLSTIQPRQKTLQSSEDRKDQANAAPSDSQAHMAPRNQQKHPHGNADHGRKGGKEETKEFDPFQDEERLHPPSDSSIVYFGSSFDLDKKVKKHKSRSSSSQPSASSSKTPKVRNTTAHKRHTSLLLENTKAAQDDDERIFRDEPGNALSPWDIDLRSNDGATTTSSNVSNSSLLRSILEEAQRRSQHSAIELPMRKKMAHTRTGSLVDVFSHGEVEYEETKTQPILRYSYTIDLPLADHVPDKQIGLVKSIPNSVGFSRSSSNPELATLPKSYRKPLPFKRIGTAGDHVTTDRAQAFAHDIVAPDSVHVDAQKPSVESATSSPVMLGIRAPREIIVPADDASLSSQDTGNPWLFDTIEQTLGPRSITADMESISGRSSRSGTSSKSQGPRRHDQVSSAAKKSNGLWNGKKAETISASGHNSFPVASDRGDRVQPDPELSSSTAATAGSSEKSNSPPTTLLLSRSSKSTRKELIVPPGKLGVVLVDHHDGRGSIVSDVRLHSPVHGKMMPGDRLIEIDGLDVSSKSVREITEIMASRVEQSRRLRVTTSIALPPDIQEDSLESESYVG